MPEPKPMDPDRIARFRDEAEQMTERYGSLPGASTLLELFNSHDFWHSEHCRVAGVLARVREIAGDPGDELDDEYTAEARKIELIREALEGLDDQEPEA